jgi:hypothetical protein
MIDYFLIISDEEPDRFNVEDLNTRLLPKWMMPDKLDVKRFPIKFFEGIKNENIDEKLNNWKSRPEKFPPFRRYEFSYLTPTCRELRIKVILLFDTLFKQPFSMKRRTFDLQNAFRGDVGD